MSIIKNNSIFELKNYFLNERGNGFSIILKLKNKNITESHRSCSFENIYIYLIHLLVDKLVKVFIRFYKKFKFFFQ